MARPAPEHDAIMAQSGYLSASDAARRTQTSPATIHRWAKNGEVACQHIGKRLYVSVASLGAKLGPVLAKAYGLLTKQQDQKGATK